MPTLQASDIAAKAPRDTAGNVMRRAALLIARVGLLVSLVSALIFILRVTFSQFLPLSWYWGGALVGVIAPASFALTLWLLGDTWMTRDGNSDA